MSNKTQLQTNNTALASLTDRVLAAKDTAAALPDAGGGGASLETCTVKFQTMDTVTVCVTIIDENGAVSVVEPAWGMDGHMEVATVENVVCGSLLAMGSGVVDISGSASVLHKDMNIAFIKAPTVAGELCVVEFV